MNIDLMLLLYSIFGVLTCHTLKELDLSKGV